MFTFPIGFTAKKETTANISRYWRLEYDQILSEIQLSFDNNPIKIPLLATNGYAVTILNGGTTKLGELNDNVLLGQYIGNLTGSTTVSIILPIEKKITSLWLHPQTGAGVTYNKPNYFKFYRSDDGGNSWTLVKHHIVSGNEFSVIQFYEFLI